MTIVNYAIPDYKLRLFTGEYSPGAAVGNTVNHESAAGWLEYGNSDVYINRYTIDDQIRQKSTFKFSINNDHLWLLNVEMIAKADAYTFYPKDPDGETIDPSGSKVVVMVKSAGDATGTVDVTGTTIEDGDDHTETFPINGEGAYVGTKTFTHINSLSTDGTHGIDATGLDGDISVWGICGNPHGRREIQLLVDGNDDGYYGLIFSGYTLEQEHNPVYGNDEVKIECGDYTEFLMSNDYNASFRCKYRCSNYQYNDLLGFTCSESPNTDEWFLTKCKTGDLHPSHPNGTDVTEDDIYSCSYYVEGTEPLQFDGYSYDEDYADSSDYGYAWYPEDYSRGLLSIAGLCNHLERDGRSNPWRVAAKAYFELDGTHTSSDTFISLKNYEGWGLKEGDYIYFVDEFMKVVSSDFDSAGYITAGTVQSSGDIVVERGALKTVAANYASDVYGRLFYVSTAEMGVTDDDPVIIETDVSSTIYGTGSRYAETMTQLLETREAIFWVDYYRNLHLLELDAEDPSNTGSFELSDDDVLAVSGLGFSEVYNHVTGLVDDKNIGETPVQLSADDVSGLENSINRFGRHVKEIDTAQINFLGGHSFDDNKRGWHPIAENYLKIYSYPRAEQTVTLSNFYPDEWHWLNSGGNSHTHMNYTDPLNKYIDVKGHKIKCSDYNFEDRPMKTWTIEGIRYKADKYGDSEVKLVLTRATDESDFT